MRTGRAAVAVLLLLFLAAPYWPQSVDDVYIPLAYAREWLESGELRWTSGERVEGYSNFTWVALLRTLLPTGVDGGVLAKTCALASAVLLLLYASRKLPNNPQATALLFAMATWAPFTRWAVDGMEAPLYALLLTIGWVSTICGNWALGMWLLGTAALTRPEGHAYLLLALPVGFWRPLRNRDRIAGSAVLLALVAYHALRVSWFQAVLPTPLLVKVAPVPFTLYGWTQAGSELATATGILVGAAAAASPSVRLGLLALVPLAVQTAVVGRASGDWMTGARLVLPGVLATAVAWSTVGVPRAWSRLACVAIMVAALPGLLYVPTGYGVARWERRASPLPAPFAGYLRGLATPLEQDVVWVVENVPEGDTVFVPDVGMLGNVPGVRVKDSRGLVQRRISEAIAAGPDAERRGISAYLAEETPSFVRLAAWGGAPIEDPAWRPDGYVVREEFGYGGGTIRWLARHDRRPDSGTVLSRWQVLHERYPAHPLFTWRLALALADAGRLDDALGIAASGPPSDRLREAPASLSFPSGPRPLDWVSGRGLGLYWNATARSRPVAGPEVGETRLRVDVDSPGAEGARLLVSTEAECGSNAVEVSVTSPSSFDIPPPACATAGEVRVRVTFTNDRSEGGDRNVYVSLESASLR